MSPLRCVLFEELLCFSEDFSRLFSFPSAQSNPTVERGPRKFVARSPPMVGWDFRISVHVSYYRIEPPT
jgi:hypothetical protein